MGGLSPIPFTAILKYAEYWGFTQRETDRLIGAIHDLHYAHSEWLDKQQSKRPPVKRAR